MTQEPLTVEASPELWNDNVWDRLLESLDERRVIPIVGPDLLHVEMDGVRARLDLHLARRLALANRLPDGNLPAERPLNYVVCKLLRSGKGRHRICYDLNQIMKETDFRPSQTLRQLAEITAFNLFVTTRFDPLLEKAIKEARLGNKQEVQSFSYSPNKVVDLPESKEKLTQPVVYYLFGKLSASGSYVISDEDLLEYVCGLQSDSRGPEKLFYALEKNDLLILGEEFSDWLARIFLRTTRGKKLSEEREYIEILADSKTHCDAGLVSFLDHFSKPTSVFWPGGAVEFVEELWKRWRARHPHSPVDAEDSPGRNMPKKGVFISYASEDLPAVRQLAAGLEEADLPVWFDKARLESGDNFKPKIVQYIEKECSCFVAVISANTERRDWGWFRREWKLAVERDEEFHHERPFIIPVIVDDTAEPRLVPPRFTQLQYTRLPGGKVEPKFVQKMRDIVLRS